MTPDHATAGGERRIGDRTHQADPAAAEHQPDARLGQSAPERLGGRPIGRDRRPTGRRKKPPLS